MSEYSIHNIYRAHEIDIDINEKSFTEYHKWSNPVMSNKICRGKTFYGAYFFSKNGCKD